MRIGRRLALDPGTARIGVAVSDRDGILASPQESLPGSDRTEAVAALDHLSTDVEPIEIIVGLPRSMDGSDGAAAQKAREFAAELAGRLSIPVRLVDERLSTVQAQRGLHAQGRSMRQSRNMIDSAAAAVVLQHALDAERANGHAPGEVCS